MFAVKPIEFWAYYSHMSRVIMSYVVCCFKFAFANLIIITPKLSNFIFNLINFINRHVVWTSDIHRISVAVKHIEAISLAISLYLMKNDSGLSGYFRSDHNIAVIVFAVLGTRNHPHFLSIIGNDLLIIFKTVLTNQVLKRGLVCNDSVCESVL